MVIGIPDNPYPKDLCHLSHWQGKVGVWSGLASHVQALSRLRKIWPETLSDPSSILKASQLWDLEGHGNSRCPELYAGTVIGRPLTVGSWPAEGWRRAQ